MYLSNQKTLICETVTPSALSAQLSFCLSILDPSSVGVSLSMSDIHCLSHESLRVHPCGQNLLPLLHKAMISLCSPGWSWSCAPALAPQVLVLQLLISPIMICPLLLYFIVYGCVCVCVDVWWGHCASPMTGPHHVCLSIWASVLETALNARFKR